MCTANSEHMYNGVILINSLYYKLKVLTSCFNVQTSFMHVKLLLTSIHTMCHHCSSLCCWHVHTTVHHNPCGFLISLFDSVIALGEHKEHHLLATEPLVYRFCWTICSWWATGCLVHPPV